MLPKLYRTPAHDVFVDFMMFLCFLLSVWKCLICFIWFAGMIGYGMAKAAVHHLVQSLACPKSGLPPDSNVVAIVPSMIDTPANRKGASADVDTSDWTKMQEFCDVISRWACDSESRMTSGSLVKFETVDNKTSISCL